MFEIMTKIRSVKHDWYLWKKYVYKPKNTFNISPMLKLKVNLSGFTADQYTLYNLRSNDSHEYITEYERWKAESINGVFAPFMSEKILLTNLFDDINTPQIFFWVEKGFCYDSKGRMTEKQIFDYIKEQRKIIAKPTHSFGHGYGLYVISIVDSQFFINDTLISQEDLYERIISSEEYIFTQFIIQDLYAQNLYPRTTNTIRVISIWRKTESAPKIILATQRIGTEKSYPADSLVTGGCRR